MHFIRKGSRARSKAAPVAALALGLLAATIQVPAVPAYASSAGGTVVIGSVTEYIGSPVDVPVMLSQPAVGVASYGFELDFDPAQVEVLGIVPRYGSFTEETITDNHLQVANTTACAATAQGCMSFKINNDEGWLRIIWVDSSGGAHPIEHTQNLFDVRLSNKVVTGFNSQVLSVDINNHEKYTLTDAAGHRLDYKLDIGSIILAPKPVEEISAKKESEDVLLDSKSQTNYATSTTTTVGSQQVKTVKIDSDKVLAKLETEAPHVLTIPISGKTDVAVAELNGKLVKAMESKEMVVQVKTDKATYTLPAAQINIDSVSSRIGKNVALQDIKINVKIADADLSKSSQMDTASRNSGASLITAPVEFQVEATFDQQKVQVDQFNDYVQREIAVPEGVEPSQITTGVVLNDDGTVSHVPTKVIQRGGHVYASINSLTNSAYSVIYLRKTFTDTESHWSQGDVNDLASRLVLEGVDAEHYGPDRMVTRGEFTLLLTRALGLHAPKAGQSVITFTDAPEAGEEVASAEKIASSYGLISGYDDGTFRPAGTITRAEAIAMIARAAQLAGIQSSSQTDAEQTLAAFVDRQEVPVWALRDFSSVVREGIVVGGAASQLLPHELLTRAESAALLRRVLIKAELIDS